MKNVRLLNTTEAAKRIGVPSTTISTACGRGALPHLAEVTDGGAKRYLVTEEHLDAWWAESKARKSREKKERAAVQRGTVSAPKQPTLPLGERPAASAEDALDRITKATGWTPLQAITTALEWFSENMAEYLSPTPPADGQEEE